MNPWRHLLRGFDLIADGMGRIVSPERRADHRIAREYMHRTGADRPLAERAARVRELTKDAPVIRRKAAKPSASPGR